MIRKVKVGIIGCGNISSIYLKNCTETFGVLEVAAVADLIPERAQEKAQEYGVPKACTVDELLADPEIELVLNLTIPKAHTEVNLAALNAGKHVYVEKPLAVTREDGRKVISLAREKNLMVGCAPDTFLGGGIQTCCKLIEDGWIGRPVAATAFMTCRGHESWHPDPEFYYELGGGPMFDMGPYYLTALIAMMGPVRRVTGSAQKTFAQRVITSAPKYGKLIDVEVPTHVAGVLDFENGAVATIVTSFDIWSAQLPRIEIYGSEGTLSVPDPNSFGGPVFVRRGGASEWSEIPLTHGFSENSRGIGAADMAFAVQSGRAHRANGDMAYHVLDIMHAIQDSSESGRHIELESSCDKPAPFPLGMTADKLD
ncbi:MAG: Gfo/Idh/MocA family protein [Caldicoprobacterales bacterium]|jgi:predicted dehydrogenase|nr:Gfo/Idh/MocA family oxidoreductase [Clostridiales bacterium]